VLVCLLASLEYDGDDEMANEEVECPNFAKILDNKLLFLM
jgi:hypothetical protein